MKGSGSRCCLLAGGAKVDVGEGRSSGAVAAVDAVAVGGGLTEADEDAAAGGKTSPERGSRKLSLSRYSAEGGVESGYAWRGGSNFRRGV